MRVAGAGREDAGALGHGALGKQAEADRLAVQQLIA